MPDQGEGHEFVSALRDLMRILETDYRGPRRFRFVCLNIFFAFFIA